MLTNLIFFEFEKDVIYMNITQNEWGFPHQNLARVYVFHKNQNKCFFAIKQSQDYSEQLYLKLSIFLIAGDKGCRWLEFKRR